MEISNLVLIFLSLVLSLGAFMLSFFNFLTLHLEPAKAQNLVKKSKIFSKSVKKAPVYHDDEELWLKEMEKKRR